MTSEWKPLNVHVERGGYAPSDAASVFPMSGAGVLMFIPRLGVRLGRYDDATGDWWVQDTEPPHDDRRNPECLLNLQADNEPGSILTPTHWMRMPEPPADTTREQCDGCKFWLSGAGLMAGEEGDRYGVCARHAPAPRLMSTPTASSGDDAWMAMWPETENEEWCGEWKAKA